MSPVYVSYKVNNLIAICEPVVWKMWKPRRLTTLWASAACLFIDIFNFLLLEYIFLK
jgi:hypothetical protein